MEKKRIQIKKLSDTIYLMDDAKEATGYLVLGKDKAIVIDTMTGREDVLKEVRTVTDLPVMVINTHGHYDHICGNIYFDKAYMHPADQEIAKEHIKWPEFLEICQKNNLGMPEFQSLYPGEIIELGNQEMEVIGLPGHTPGGIGLLLTKDKVLFTGDSINRHLWMQLEESSTLQEYADYLDQIQNIAQRVKWILHGHAKGFEPISLLEDMRNGIQEILDGRQEEDEVFHWMGEDATIHYYGNERNAIVYRREKTGKEQV